MIFDLVGIGAGPFNLSLGILLKDTKLKKFYFLDKKKQIFFWHSGMKLKILATIQNSNLKDLVSLVKPTSEYSFF